MVEYHNAPREIYRVPEVMFRISVIQSFEEDKYSDIPKWDGLIDSWTDAAILLHFDKVQRPAAMNWFPISHIRKTDDGLSIYASIWILNKKGF